MTKGQFIEFIQHNLSGGASVQDKSDKYPLEVIELAVAMILQDLASVDFRTGPDNIMNALISRHEMVSVSSENGLFFFVLPVSTMGGNGSVRRVAPDRMGAAFSIHASLPQMAMMSELKGSAMRIGVYPDGSERWTFTKNPFLDEVFVSYIPDFREYDDDEEFVVGDQYMTVYAKIEQMFAPVAQRLLDQRNDNAIEDEQRTRG